MFEFYNAEISKKLLVYQNDKYWLYSEKKNIKFVLINVRILINFN